MIRLPARELFRTAAFLESPWIAELCQTVGDVWVSDDETWGQHGHFTTFFGVIIRRAGYRNQVLHDLYMLHELWHRRTIRYERGRTWLQWSRDLIASELSASLTSECLVYFRIPGLREQTFSHEIWVDRFHALRGRPIDQVELHIRHERLRALNAPSHDDFLEHQIANYGRQNMLWARVWAGAARCGPTPDLAAFRVVDEHMSRADREDHHLDWLAAHADDTGLPFPSQAAGFQPIYERSQREFGNDVLSR